MSFGNGIDPDVVHCLLFPGLLFQDLIRCLKDVGQAPAEKLTLFLPLVLDKLLLLMVKPPTVAGLTLNVGQAAFGAMAAVAKVLLSS